MTSSTIIAPLPDGSPREEENMLPELLYSLIADGPFFEGLSPEYLRLLADSAFEMKFEPGQAIFNEGSPANRFYLILAGKVVLESEPKERGPVTIQTLGPGDILGWSWLFAPYYLYLSARTVEPTRTISFFGTRLREQCEQDHELGYQMMKRTAEVVLQCLQATQLRLMERADSLPSQV